MKLAAVGARRLTQGNDNGAVEKTLCNCQHVVSPRAGHTGLISDVQGTSLNVCVCVLRPFHT